MVAHVVSPVVARQGRGAAQAETSRATAAPINDSLKLLWYHTSSSYCCNLLLALGGIEFIGLLVWVFGFWGFFFQTKDKNRQFSSVKHFST